MHLSVGSSMISDSVGLVERRYQTWHEPLQLESGASIAPLTLAYEIYGNSIRAGVMRS